MGVALAGRALVLCIEPALRLSRPCGLSIPDATAGVGRTPGESYSARPSLFCDALYIDNIFYQYYNQKPANSKIQSMLNITVELTDSQALALAQLIKRIPLSDLRSNAQDEEEAYVMQGALQQVRKALSEQGFNPR